MNNQQIIHTYRIISLPWNVHANPYLVTRGVEGAPTQLWHELFTGKNIPLVNFRHDEGNFI